MTGEWRKTTLGECATWLSGGTPFKGNEAFWSGPIPWVSAKDMKSFRLHDAEDHISPLAVGNGGKLIPTGTILLLVRGMTLHKDVPICMVTREMAFNQDIKALRPAKNVDPAFLAYWLLANKPELLASVDHAGHGTGRLVTETLKEKPVLLPPLAEQKAIAAVLGALDDKIDLNRRINATLEAMVRALFQSWFVDFDPVRAKLDGRQPEGNDPATAALFPDAFEDFNAGRIPKGWTVRPLSSHARYLSRGIGPAYLERGGVCVLNQKCIRDHRVDFAKSRRHDAVKKPINGRAVQPFDVLVNSTGMGTLGRVAQVFDLPEMTVVDSHVTVVRADEGTDALFLGINLTGREAEIEELGEGSTGQTELSRARLGQLRIVAPPFELQVAFGTAIRPLLMQISENESQSRTLATLRDTLLPKLLSGELSVATFHPQA